MQSRVLASGSTRPPSRAIFLIALKMVLPGATRYEGLRDSETSGKHTLIPKWPERKHLGNQTKKKNVTRVCPTAPFCLSRGKGIFDICSICMYSICMYLWFESSKSGNVPPCGAHTLMISQFSWKTIFFRMTEGMFKWKVSNLCSHVCSSSAPHPQKDCATEEAKHVQPHWDASKSNRNHVHGCKLLHVRRSKE